MACGVVPFGCALAHAPEATEMKRPLDLPVASLAERSQIPRQNVPLIVIQVVRR